MTNSTTPAKPKRLVLNLRVVITALAIIVLLGVAGVGTGGAAKRGTSVPLNTISPNALLAREDSVSAINYGIPLLAGDYAATQHLIVGSTEVADCVIGTDATTDTALNACLKHLPRGVEVDYPFAVPFDGAETFMGGTELSDVAQPSGVRFSVVIADNNDQPADIGRVDFNCSDEEFGDIPQGDILCIPYTDNNGEGEWLPSFAESRAVAQAAYLDRDLQTSAALSAKLSAKISG